MLATFGGNADFVRALVANDVHFLVVGGLAVSFYGCRELEQVDDLDLLLNPSLENAKKLADILAARGFAPVLSPAQIARPNVQIPLKSRSDYYLDLLTPGRNVVYEQLVGRSVPARLQGDLSIRLIGRDDLIEMKREAVAKRDTGLEKHERDLRCLLAARAGTNQSTDT